MCPSGRSDVSGIEEPWRVRRCVPTDAPPKTRQVADDYHVGTVRVNKEIFLA